MFLDSIREKEEAEEKARREMDGEEVKSFKEAVAARMQQSNPPPTLPSTSTAKPPAPKKETKQPVVMKKDAKKSSLKGVVVKKKKASGSGSAPEPKPGKTARSWDTDANTADDEPTSKKRRVSESES